MPRIVQLFVVVFGVVLGACGGEGDGITPPPPPTPLSVSATSPAAASQTADPFSLITATFNIDLDPSTAIASAFPVTQGTTTLTATMAYDQATRTASINAPLVPGTAYQASVATSARSTTGQQLAQAHTWTFTTRPWQVGQVGGKVPGGAHSLIQDPSGTLHRLVPVVTGGGTSRSIRYESCATACEQAGSWQGADIFTSGSVDGHGLIVEAGGRRHAFFQNGSAGRVRYGTCTSDCTSAAGWQTAQLSFSASGDGGHGAISVVQEPSGRLMLVTGGWTGANYGVLFATCAADCLAQASWQFGTVTEVGTEPALVLDASGTLHLLYRRNADFQQVYGRCQADCTNPAAWQTADITPHGSFGEISLLSATSGLHAVFNPGNEIRYRFCPADCLTPNNWTSVTIDPTSNNSRSATLAQGPDGRFHIFYADKGNDRYSYATCVANCTTAAAWQKTVVTTGVDPREARVVLDAAGKPTALVDDYGGGGRVILVR